MTRKEELQLVTIELKRKLQQETGNLFQGQFPMPGEKEVASPEVLFDKESGARILSLVTELGTYQDEFEKITASKK